MLPGKRILVTGPAGLHMQTMFEKLSDYVPKQYSYTFYKVEDYMTDIHLEQHEEETWLRQPGGFQALLLHPKEYLINIWKQAITRLTEKIPSDRPAIISLHGVYYHTGNREFFSCVQMEPLKGLNITKVVTLVDDVYDIWARLRGPGQLLDPQLQPAESRITASIRGIMSLIELLDWRSVEILVSEQIARQLGLGSEFLLLPVKHRLEVVKDLLFSIRRPIYVSHPISEPRRLGRIGIPKSIEADVMTLTNLLVDIGQFAPISPTAIDEFRIAKSRDEKAPLTLDTLPYVPRLTSRWGRNGASKLLYVAPGNGGVNPLDPMNFAGESKAIPSSVSVLLSALAEKIAAQINSRDRALVEKSDALVLWRPYFNGSLSYGMLQEIAFRNRLADWSEEEKQPKTCYVYSPPSDLARWRVGLIIAELRGGDPSQQKLTALRSALEKDSKVMRNLEAGVLTTEQLRKHTTECGVSLPASYQSQSRHPVAMDMRTAALVTSELGWQQMVDRTNSEDRMKEYKREGDIWYEANDIEPVEFLRDVGLLEHNRHHG